MSHNIKKLFCFCFCLEKQKYRKNKKNKHRDRTASKTCQCQQHWNPKKKIITKQKLEKDPRRIECTKSEVHKSSWVCRCKGRQRDTGMKGGERTLVRREAKGHWSSGKAKGWSLGKAKGWSSEGEGSELRRRKVGAQKAKGRLVTVAFFKSVTVGIFLVWENSRRDSLGFFFFFFFLD